MQVGTPAGLDLAKIDRNGSITSHDTKESTLVVPGPAPNAGANTGRHRKRLTRAAYEPIPSHVFRLKTTREA